MKKKTLRKNDTAKMLSVSYANDMDVMFKGVTIAIPCKLIYIAAYMYMILPILVFFATWLKWYIGALAIALTICGTVFLFKNMHTTERLILPRKHLILAFAVVTVWMWSSSIFFFQTWDNHYRNAIFWDLCNYKWPVIYPESGNALVYYLMQWIIPAAVGKIFGITVANITLLIWNILGVFLVFLGICIVVRPKSNGQIWAAIVIFLTWSGLSAIGHTWVDIRGFGSFGLTSGYDWPALYYGYAYQFTPNDALLAWVYNQTIVPWLGVVLFMADKRLRNFAFLGLCILPYGPLPFVGLLLFFVAIFFESLAKNGFKDTLKECLSVQNICASIGIFPVFYLYFKTNVAGSYIGFYEVVDTFGIRHIIFLVAFYLLQFGIYCLLIGREYKKSTVFWTVVISLVLIPHIKVGFSRDFCMRASIPALLILMILIIQFLYKNYEFMGKSFKVLLLVICLTISGYSITKDWATRVKGVRANGWSPVVTNEVVTLSDKDAAENANFLVPDPENSAFYKYLAR